MRSALVFHCGLRSGSRHAEQGAIYPALYRLERQGLIAGTWGTSDNNRRAKFYSLTPAGRRRLREEEAGWQRMVDIMAGALRHRPGEA